MKQMILLMKIKKINDRKLFWIVLLVFFFWISGNVYADSVILKNGSILKGIIVKEYSDRVILRIPDGEVGIYKTLISRVVYLRPEQNLLEKGNEYAKKGEFDEALVRYRDALKVNPDFEEARNAISRVSDAKQSQKEISEEQLKQSLGIIIKKEGDEIKIVSVDTNSPASRVGIKPEDIIETIWDVHLKYEKLDKAIALLTGEKGTSVSLAIRRQVSPIRRKIRWYQKEFVGIGISVKMEEKGVIITDVSSGQPADKAGLKSGDCIVAIEGKSIRYTSLSEAIKMMAGQAGTPLNLIITRKINILRGGYKKIKAAPTLVLPVVKEEEAGGIGVQIVGTSKGPKVVNVLYRSPAEIAGLKRSDLLVRIDKKPCRNLSSKESAKLLKSDIGSIVQIAIERKISLIRQKIPGENFGGIGCTLNKGENGFEIGRLLPNGAAEEARMKKGDIIVRVGNKDIADKISSSQFVEEIRGQVGTKLNLTIRRNLAIKRTRIGVQ